MLTAFWLFGGRHGSPSATLEAYVEAWIADQPSAAASLFATPHEAADVSAEWSTERAAIADRIAAALAVYGDESGLDPDRPFANLRFREAPPADNPDGRVGMIVEIVRSRRVESMVLGIVPTASQETVSVEQAATIWLEQRPEPPLSWWPFGTAQSTWRISTIEATGDAP